MSLYKDASLVMIPSAYKDGKLYSIRPTDGSGDFTFSRGSNLAATRVDVNGLIEKGRENLLLQSNQFDTTWSTSSSSITGGQSGYDGGSNAWLLQATASTSTARLQQGVSLTGVHTTSIYAKAGSTDWIAIQMWSNHFAYFDVANGVVGNSGSAIDASIEAAGNGFYRCSISYSASSVGNLWVYVIDGNGSTSVTSGKNVYLQSAQVELGLVATDYIETGTSAAQSGILEDMPRLDYSGGASCPSLLLEPQRSNLLEQAEYFGASYWSKANVDVELADTLSPDGFKNAYKITETSASGQHAINVFSSSRPNLSAGSHTHSCFVKVNGVEDIVFYNNGSSGGAGVNIDLSDGTYSNLTGGATAASVEPYSNNWYRITLTFTAVVGNSSPSIYLRTTGSYTGDGVSGIYIYGMQTEQGSYPTSYIPTYGTSQTRSNEAATSPADTLDSLSAFTWFFEISRIGFSGDMSSSALSLRTASGAEQIRCHFDAPSQQIRIRDAINGYTTIGASLPVTVGTYIKICVVSDGETIKTFANGSQRGGAYNIVTQHDVERVYMNEKGFNCKQLLVFPTALTDSECIALTTL